jgi:hypothetical protein
MNLEVRVIEEVEGQEDEGEEEEEEGEFIIKKIYFEL